MCIWKYLLLALPILWVIGTYTINNSHLYPGMSVCTVFCLPQVPSGGRRGLIGTLAHRPAGQGPNHGHGTAETRRRPP